MATKSPQSADVEQARDAREGEPVIVRPSKTKRKSELDELRRFGEEIVGLSPGYLARLNLPDELRQAVNEARRLKVHGARKRQLLTIGRLMESVDADAIRADFVGLTHPQRAPVASPRELTETERLAEQLVTEGDVAVFALTERYGREDLQTLRQAVRLARKQVADGTARSVAAKAVAACLARL